MSSYLAQFVWGFFIGLAAITAYFNARKGDVARTVYWSAAMIALAVIGAGQ